MCSITGVQMKTFDSLSYKFQGTCDYVLSKDSKNKFAIIMENVRCINITNPVIDSCGKNVKLAAEGGSIDLIKNKIVLIDGVKVQLPFIEDGMLIKEVCTRVKERYFDTSGIPA